MFNTLICLMKFQMAGLGKIELYGEESRSDACVWDIGARPREEGGLFIGTKIPILAGRMGYMSHKFNYLTANTGALPFSLTVTVML